MRGVPDIVVMQHQGRVLYGRLLHVACPFSHDVTGQRPAECPAGGSNPRAPTGAGLPLYGYLDIRFASVTTATAIDTAAPIQAAVITASDVSAVELAITTAQAPQPISAKPSAITCPMSPFLADEKPGVLELALYSTAPIPA